MPGNFSALNCCKFINIAIDFSVLPELDLALNRISLVMEIHVSGSTRLILRTGKKGLYKVL